MATADQSKLFHSTLSPLPENFGHIQACPHGDVHLDSLHVWMIDTPFSELYQTFLCSAINQPFSEGNKNPEERLSIYNWDGSEKLKISEENIKNEKVQKLFDFYFWNKHY